MVGPEPRLADTPWHTGMVQTGGLMLSRPSRLSWQWFRDPLRAVTAAPELRTLRFSGP